VQATVSQWGNSLGLRLPQKLVKATGIEKGDVVELDLENDRFTVRKVRIKKTFKQIISEETKPYSAQWVEWGKPEGDEIW
jgi:antitoxin MazE